MKYLCEAQQRILSAVVMLFGHEIDGLTPGQLAKLTRSTPAQTTRDLANLRIAGLAEQMDNGNWRLTPRLPQRALAMLNNLDRAADRIRSTQQRYTDTPPDQS